MEVGEGHNYGMKKGTVNIQTKRLFTISITMEWRIPSNITGTKTRALQSGVF